MSNGANDSEAAQPTPTLSQLEVTDFINLTKKPLLRCWGDAELGDASSEGTA